MQARFYAAVVAVALVLLPTGASARNQIPCLTRSAITPRSQPRT